MQPAIGRIERDSAREMVDGLGAITPLAGDKGQPAPAADKIGILFRQFAENRLRLVMPSGVAQFVGEIVLQPAIGRIERDSAREMVDGLGAITPLAGDKGQPAPAADKIGILFRKFEKDRLRLVMPSGVAQIVGEIVLQPEIGRIDFQSAFPVFDRLGPIAPLSGDERQPAPAEHQPGIIGDHVAVGRGRLIEAAKFAQLDPDFQPRGDILRVERRCRPEMLQRSDTIALLARGLRLRHMR